MVPRLPSPRRDIHFRRVESLVVVVVVVVVVVAVVEYYYYYLLLLISLIMRINSVHDNSIVVTPSPPIKSLDFRGFDSSRLLILRGGNSHAR